MTRQVAVAGHGFGAHGCWVMHATCGIAMVLAACGGSSPPADDGRGLSQAETTAAGQSYCDLMRVEFGPTQEGPRTTLNPQLGVVVRQRAETPLSAFTLDGIAQRSPEELANPIFLPKDRFATLHGGTRNSDQVRGSLAPVFIFRWTARPGLFLPEGPVFGDRFLFGASGFFFPGTDADLALFALDRESGVQQWQVVPGQTGQTGSALVLRDPDIAENVVYAGGARAIFAVTESGQRLWCTDTGLGFPEDPFEAQSAHVFGVNYHPATDSVVAVLASGDMAAFDRRSGQLIGRFRIPGAPAVGSNVVFPEFLLDDAERAFRRAFVPPDAEVPEDFAFLGGLIDAVLGGGGVVGNYFSTDPDSDLLWVAATLDDLADDNPDGQAAFGGLYGLRLARGGPPEEAFSIHCVIPFEGGSASTPAVQAGGDRIYTADAFGKALAFDRDCEPLWSLDVGEQIVASLSVSETGGEIYAATGKSIVKIVDLGDEARIAWRSDLDPAFVAGPLLLPLTAAVQEIGTALGLPPPVNLRAANLTTALIGENAIASSSGLGLGLGPDAVTFLPLAIATTILDRDSGEVINATPGQEESVAVVAAGPDGGIFLGNSPIRRAFLRGLVEPGEGGLMPVALDPLTSQLIPPLSGGYTRYAPTRAFDLHARDASCFAERRLAVWLGGRDAVDFAFAESAEAAAAQILLRQTRENLDRALRAGDLSTQQHAELSQTTGEAGDALASLEIESARQGFARVCEALTGAAPLLGPLARDGADS